MLQCTNTQTISNQTSPDPLKTQEPDLSNETLKTPTWNIQSPDQVHSIIAKAYFNITCKATMSQNLVSCPSHVKRPRRLMQPRSLIPGTFSFVLPTCRAWEVIYGTFESASDIGFAFPIPDKTQKIQATACFKSKSSHATHCKKHLVLGRK